MGKDSGIEWTHHTFNPWWGCARVSPGCENCYAEAFDKRVSGKDRAHWGVKSERRFFGDAHWREPLKWNAAAQKAGERHRVFCASMADVFEDRDDLDEWRLSLWGLIECTPHLDWLLLTKRPENIEELEPESWRRGWPRNIWAGCTVEDQKRADERIPHLLRVPAAVRFLSCEPLLEHVNLQYTCFNGADSFGTMPGIHWIIVGGESGHGARPFHVDWARSIVKQCRDAKVSCFVKQLGANVRDRNDAGFQADLGYEGDEWSFGHFDPTECIEHNPNGYREEYQGAPVRIFLRDKKGGDMSEWPESLRVREFPKAHP